MNEDERAALVAEIAALDRQRASAQQRRVLLALGGHEWEARQADRQIADLARRARLARARLAVLDGQADPAVVTAIYREASAEAWAAQAAAEKYAAEWGNRIVEDDEDAAANY